MIWWLWIIIAIVVIVVIILIYYFNRFVVLENRINNSSAQIDVQLRKRADLVPSLVKVVKGYARHEKQLFENVTKARAAVLKGQNVQERAKAGNQLQQALKSIFAVAENYPQLQANQNFLHLQKELAAIEDKVAYSRQFYNDSVLALENASQKFPGVVFFKMFGRQRKDYLKIPAEAKAMPKISFD